jgi:hypothetical protein
MAAALRVVILTPLIDAGALARECGEAASTIDQLVSRGMAKIHKSSKRDGRSTTLYAITSKGMAALDAHSATPTPTPAPAPAGMYEPPISALSTWTPTGYAGLELGRTCHRPGAYDAFTLPSMIGSERRTPKCAA